jgi:hypothetical protein
MFNSFFILPFLLRFRSTFYTPTVFFSFENAEKYIPFMFPEGFFPNISDPTTYESFEGLNKTLLNQSINNCLLQSLENISSEEIIDFTRNNITVPKNYFKSEYPSKYPDMIFIIDM